MNVSVQSWLRSPALALVAGVGLLAAAVEHLAPSAGMVTMLRDNRSANAAPIRTSSGAYPRAAWDADGFAVRMAQPARSVVSQYWSIDEFLYSIIPAAHVTGVSETAYMEKISNVFAPVQKHRPVVSADPERVLSVNPDLILVWSSARADYTALVRSTGVPIFRMMTTFTSLEQVANSIRLIGYLTGEDAAAEAEYQRFQQAVEAARQRRPDGAKPPRVLGMGGRSSYGDETLFHDVLTTLGAINVGAEGGLHGYSSVNTEQILRWDPEWIVIGADADKFDAQRARLLADPAIALTQAARNGRIVVLDQRVFLPMSPFTTRMLDALGKAFYDR